MKTGEACNRNVVVAKRHMPVPAAAKLMRQAHAGCLVVVDDPDERIPVGIVTLDGLPGLLASEFDHLVNAIDNERPRVGLARH